MSPVASDAFQTGVACMKAARQTEPAGDPLRDRITYFLTRFVAPACTQEAAEMLVSIAGMAMREGGRMKTEADREAVGP